MRLRHSHVIVFRFLLHGFVFSIRHHFFGVGLGEKAQETQEEAAGGQDETGVPGIRRVVQHS